MTRRPLLLFVIGLFLLVSIVAIAQHSNPSSSSSSSSSSGGHASPASSSPSASYSGSSRSGGASYSGGSSPSHSNSGSNAASHSGGWNHSGGNSGGNRNARSNVSPGGSAGRGDHSYGNHGTRSNSNDQPRSGNQPNHSGSQPNGAPRFFEATGPARGNANHSDSTRGERPRDRTRPGVRESATLQPDSEHRSRMSRIFLFWKHPQKNPDATALAKRGKPEIKRPNPCKGVGCKPVCLPGQTLENGACAGKPIPTPQGEIRCPDGSIQVNGACPTYNSAYSRSTAACGVLARQIDSLERQLQQLYDARNRECARDPNGVACYNVANQIVVLEQQLQQLRRQYAACMSAHP